MWIPRIDRDAPALARQLLDALTDDIAAGVLKPGAQMPTHRDLADVLRIGVGTVTQAYGLAKRRGLIDSTVGRGTFVVDRDSIASSGPIDLSQNYVHCEAASELLHRSLEQPPDLRAIAANFNRRQTTGAGVLEHREAASRWLTRPGLDAHPERVALCAGVQCALFALAAAHAQQGDGILCEDLTYAGIRGVAALLRLRVKGVRTDRKGMVPDDLERAASKGARILYVTPNFHNPTASTLSDKRRRKIAEIACARDLIILEDDAYGPFASHPPTPIAHYAPERTFFLSGTSKCLLPGLRLGFIVCPPREFERTAFAIRSAIFEVSPVMSEWFAGIVNDGTASAMLEAKRKEVAERNRMASALLAGHVDQNGDAECPHLWIETGSKWRSADTFIAEANRKGVLVSPSSIFAVGDGPVPDAIRVCLGAQHSRAAVERALTVIRDLLSGRGGNEFQSV